MKHEIGTVVDRAVPSFEEWFAELAVQEYKADYATLHQNMQLKEVRAL